MPRIQIPSSNIGQNAILNRGSSSQSSLSYLRSAVIYPTITSPYTIRGSFNNPNFYFWIFGSTSNSTKGNVSITYPWSETANTVGLYNNAFTGVYSYITLRVNVNYGYTFTNWSYSYPGGPVASYSTSFNVDYNGPFYDTSLYANFA